MMKIILIEMAFGLFLAGCTVPMLTPSIHSTPTITISVPALKPTATEIFRQDLSPTVTDIQLPYNLVESDASYCQPPYAFLPKPQTAELSDDEIALELVRLWLSRYEKAEAHPYCRIDGYIINAVYFDEYTSLLPLEPKGDFLRMADFSVKLIQVPNVWMSFPGYPDQDHWLHLKHAIVITKVDDGYRMEFAYP